ncbi:MAG: hypothetical protein IPJ81_15645 [Chitinophagaceae bacterium]|nr:hypothetical protein [Chitinophagaceae bacterium]
MRKKEFTLKYTYKFIDNVEQLSTKNYPLTDYSGYQDFYYIRDYNPYLKEDMMWKEEYEDKLVQAEYNVCVTDARYIQHLKEDMVWGTTSYETKALTVKN